MTQKQQSRNYGCHCLSMTNGMSFKIGLMVSGLKSASNIVLTLWPKALNTFTEPLSTDPGVQMVAVNLVVRLAV